MAFVSYMLYVLCFVGVVVVCVVYCVCWFSVLYVVAGYCLWCGVFECVAFGIGVACVVFVVSGAHVMCIVCCL